jgi:hypothetical protein
MKGQHMTEMQAVISGLIVAALLILMAYIFLSRTGTVTVS